MKRAQYRIPVSKKNTAILKQLNQTGELVFDEYYIAKDAYVLVLTSAEFELLKQYEIKATRVEKKETELPEEETVGKTGNG